MMCPSASTGWSGMSISDISTGVWASTGRDGHKKDAKESIDVSMKVRWVSSFKEKTRGCLLVDADVA